MEYRFCISPILLFIVILYCVKADVIATATVTADIKERVYNYRHAFSRNIRAGNDDPTVSQTYIIISQFDNFLCGLIQVYEPIIRETITF